MFTRPWRPERSGLACPVAAARPDPTWRDSKSAPAEVVGMTTFMRVAGRNPARRNDDGRKRGGSRALDLRRGPAPSARLTRSRVGEFAHPG